MKQYAGLDVSRKEISICVVDADGAVLVRGTAPARTKPVSVVHPLGRAFMHPGAAQLVNVQRHQPVSDKTQHLGQKLVIRCLRKKRFQRRGFCYRVLGHG